MEVRVGDIAKEFDVPLAEVLAYLAVLGEEGASASSLLKDPSSTGYVRGSPSGQRCQLALPSTPLTLRNQSQRS